MESKSPDRSERWVNTGLIKWEAARASWLRSGVNRAACVAKPLAIEPIVDAVYCTTGVSQVFDPVTLPQLVDVLNDLWDAEGLE